MAPWFTYASHYFLASSRSRAHGESWTFSWAGGSLPALLLEMVRMKVHDHLELSKSYELDYPPYDS